MNVRQRFDGIIEAIEKRASDPCADPKELAEEVAASNAMPLRDMNTVFNYLTGNTLRAYIKDRKMMASYRFLITGKTRDIQGALYIAGYSDQQNYSNAFKNRFGIAPGEAFKEKDHTLYEEPLIWDRLSQETLKEAVPETTAQKEDTHFGIKLDQYGKVAKAMELEAFYDFTPLFSQFAFDLSETTGKPLQDTFKYTDSLREYLGDAEHEPNYAEDTFSAPPKSKAELLHEYGSNPFYQRMFFDRGIGISTIDYFQSNHDATEAELLNCNEDMLAAYSETYHMSFHFFMKAWRRYMEYTNGKYDPEGFEAFVGRLDSNMTIDEALGEMVYDLTDEDYDIDLPMCTSAQEAAWDMYYSELDDILDKAYNRWNGGRIDEEPDMDNLDYYDKDADDMDRFSYDDDTSLEDQIFLE